MGRGGSVFSASELRGLEVVREVKDFRYGVIRLRSFTEKR